MNISCKVVFCLNKWNKKVGSPSSFGRKRPFISPNSSASIENLSSSERTRARARANHAKNDAQKGCAMQLNGITLSVVSEERSQRLPISLELVPEDFQPNHSTSSQSSPCWFKSIRQQRYRRRKWRSTQEDIHEIENANSSDKKVIYQRMHPFWARHS